MGRNKKLQEIDLSLNSLVVFRKLLTHDVILPLRALLDTESMDPMIQLRQYTEFISRLYARSTNLTEYIFRLICEDENFYVKAAARGEEIDEMLEACVQNELAILQRLARIRPHELQKEVSYYGVLPEWKTSDLDFGAEYHARLREIGKYGYGLFAQYKMFLWRDEMIVPVLSPEPDTLEDFIGYDAERQAAAENIEALLRGEPAQNMLFYGDAGTGKSMLARALVNSYADDGLRMIALKQSQIPDLPQIREQLSGHPLKFIVFLDDLDLQPADGSIYAMKSVLEGGVSPHTENTVICAACNFRQTVSDACAASGGDGSRGDAPEAVHALLERFGLRLLFRQPDREHYLRYVQFFAEQHGLYPQTDTLSAPAEQYAARSGGRSPRAAKQFIEQLAVSQ